MFIFIQGEPQAQWAVQLVTQVSALTRIFYKFYKKNFIKAFLKEFSALSTAQQESQQTNKHFYYSWRSIVVCRLLVLQVRISFYFCNTRITQKAASPYHPHQRRNTWLSASEVPRFGECLKAPPGDLPRGWRAQLFPKRTLQSSSPAATGTERTSSIGTDVGCRSTHHMSWVATS